MHLPRGVQTALEPELAQNPPTCSVGDGGWLALRLASHLFPVVLDAGHGVGALVAGLLVIVLAARNDCVAQAAAGHAHEALDGLIFGALVRSLVRLRSRRRHRAQVAAEDGGGAHGCSCYSLCWEAGARP